jgi:hypothetical protein
MNNCNVIDIGQRVNKRCGMYSEEYKNWIARKSKTPAIVETIDSFEEYWARAIMLVNQTSILAAQHGYGMAAMDNNALHVSYSKLLANFGTAYAATQETSKTQATSMAAMQGQLTNIQQFCMAVGQQPPPTIYAPPHTATAHVQQLPRQMQWRWARRRFQQRQRRWRLPTTTNLVWRQWSWQAETKFSSHSLQALGKLELLPHPWRQRGRRPLEHNM